MTQWLFCENPSPFLSLLVFVFYASMTPFHVLAFILLLPNSDSSSSAPQSPSPSHTPPRHRPHRLILVTPELICTFPLRTSEESSAIPGKLRKFSRIDGVAARRPHAGGGGEDSPMPVSGGTDRAPNPVSRSSYPFSL